MSGPVSRFFRPALRTLKSLTSQKKGSKKSVTKESDRFFPIYVSKFQPEHADALRVSFETAGKYDVIPNVKVTIPEQYVLPKVNREALNADKLNFESLDIKDDHVKTFVTKLQDVVRNSELKTGTSESTTDSLIGHLLFNVINFDSWPFKVRIKPPLRLITSDDESVSAIPEFVVNKEDINFISVEDKHLKNHKIYPLNGYGEVQIGGEILACGFDNTTRNYVDQEIFAIRAISNYVTFYRANISSSYWDEFRKRLPIKQSVVIKRWPEVDWIDGKKSGLNLVEPEGRKAVITDLFKIRQYLLNLK